LQLRIEVYNEHITGAKKFLGSASIPLSIALPSKNMLHTFVMPLSYKIGKKEKYKGTATITAQVVDTRSVFYQCGCPVS
jgi:hypothetical protein